MAKSKLRKNIINKMTDLEIITFLRKNKSRLGKSGSQGEKTLGGFNLLVVMIQNTYPELSGVDTVNLAIDIWENQLIPSQRSYLNSRARKISLLRKDILFSLRLFACCLFSYRLSSSRLYSFNCFC